VSTNSEATRLNLAYYRKQAKALLKAAQTGDPEALARLARHSPNTRPALHHAQLTVARERGFPSWPRFRAFMIESTLAQSALDFQSLANTFIEAALTDLRRAEETLAAHPEIARAGFYTALVLGDAERVRQALDETPALAVTNGGPRQWEPLLYVCFSLFANGKSTRAGSLTETARVLLRCGADPNTSYTAAQWPDSPLSALYGATGRNDNPALALALLEAGANPNDNESLYHSTEHSNLACMKLLLDHGALPAGSNALKHMLDHEDLEGLRLLLNAGADPNEVGLRGATALHWAVWRGRSARAITMLLDSGVALDARRKDGRTAYALAVIGGQTEIAALLESRGANTELAPPDRLLAAGASADPAVLSRLLTESPGIALPLDSEQLLPDLASNHRTAAVRALLAAGVAVDARDGGGATALHWACWKGYADLVKVLLDHGASLTIEDNQFHAPPPGWFDHGLHSSNEKGGDYPQVARLLLAAGATLAATGDAGVDAVLRQHAGYQGEAG
jgi:ankyrin repeat protein